MKVTLLGAGHIGQTIARLLHGSGDYRVRVLDKNDTALTTSVVGNEGRVWIDATGLAGVAIDVFADHSCRATLPATLPAPDAAGQVLVGELTCIQRTATSRSEP